MSGVVLSLNVGVPRATAHNPTRITGIDKQPVRGRVRIDDPGVERGVSGVTGDVIGNGRHHGGSDQAVYAYAREDLDLWERELGRALQPGAFGENLTTRDLDITGARIGERWRVGDTCLLEVCCPRIPCRTFAAWLREQAWERRFTRRGVPGAYLRVVEAGEIGAGDPVSVVSQPRHGVTICFMFRALTTEKRLLPELAVAGAALPRETQEALGLVQG